MEKDIAMDIHVTEDSTHTMVHCMLDLRGDHFESMGRAKRNPTDPPRPLIGEELALARALAKIQHDIMEAAQEKISTLVDS